VTAAHRDLGQGDMNGAIHAEQVDLDHALERIRSHRRDRPKWRCDAGVRYDDVEGTEPLHRGRDRVVEGVAVGGVAGQRERPLADARRRGTDLVGVEVGERDRCAPGVQQAGGLEADPARRSGHERGSAGEGKGGQDAISTGSGTSVAFPWRSSAALSSTP
jgi:hypothetical protein